jgi:hypothetical protein
VQGVRGRQRCRQVLLVVVVLVLVLVVLLLLVVPASWLAR